MDEELSKRRLTKNQKIALGVIIGIIILFGLIYIYRQKQLDKVFSGYSIKTNVELDAQIPAESRAFGEGIIWYSVDGISYFSGGRQVWNKSINMKSPVIDTCGDYIVMAERKSNDIYVFDVNGKESKIASTYPVIDVSVSKQGVVAATLDDGEANYVEITDKEGTKIASGRTVLSGDGYPVDISISEDSTRLIASYLSVSNGETQSKVVFYNFSSVGENEVDRIVGGFNQYKSTLVPEVEFINNNTAVAVGDNMFTIYSVGERPSIAYEEEFTDKIDSVFFSKKCIGLVFRSNDTSYSQVLKVYNEKGKVVFTKALDFKYKDICFVGENVVMYDSSNCRMYSFVGTERFNGDFDMNINMLVPLKADKYVVLTDNGIKEIELN